jgi:hypothetical protein
MNTLNFNDADLKVNREGRLSDAQQKRLDAELDQIQQWSKLGLWGSIGVFVLISIAIVINTYTYLGKDLATMLSRMTSIGFVIIATVFMVIFLLLLYIYSWSASSFVNEPIRMIQGTAEVVKTHITTRDGKRTPVNKLVLHSNWYTWFTFTFADEDSLRYFESGHRYRIYYLVYYLPWPRPQALSSEEITQNIKYKVI